MLPVKSSDTKAIENLWGESMHAVSETKQRRGIEKCSPVTSLAGLPETLAQADVKATAEEIMQSSGNEATGRQDGKTWLNRKTRTKI